MIVPVAAGAGGGSICANYDRANHRVVSLRPYLGVREPPPPTGCGLLTQLGPLSTQICSPPSAAPGQGWKGTVVQPRAGLSPIHGNQPEQGQSAL